MLRFTTQSLPTGDQFSAAQRAAFGDEYINQFLKDGKLVSIGNGVGILGTTNPTASDDCGVAQQYRSEFPLLARRGPGQQ